MTRNADLVRESAFLPRAFVLSLAVKTQRGEIAVCHCCV